MTLNGSRIARMMGRKADTSLRTQIPKCFASLLFAPSAVVLMQLIGGAHAPFAVVFQWSRRDTTREAHRFNSGLMIISGLSPVRTTEPMGVVQPSLRDSISSVRHPALKRWAGIVMSLRDAAPRTLWSAVASAARHRFFLRARESFLPSLLVPKSLTENWERCCGEGFWLWARRRSSSIPAAACKD
jgi:hypothetical protein